MKILANHYEYAGFLYQIAETMTGIWAYEENGQHPAAGKDKHRRAAVECWRQANPSWYPGKKPTLEEQQALRIRQLEQDLALERSRTSDASWITNPDRMGGQFTQQEIDESRRGGHGW